ncbi:MAG: hypothetical protein WDN69_05610 [Aliidongia sp.]
MNINQASATGFKRGTVLGLVSLGLGLSGIIPTYGIIGSVAGLVVGVIGWLQARAGGNRAGVLLSVIAIYLCAIRIVLTLIVVLVFSNVLNSSSPTIHRLPTAPPHVTEKRL